jgi:heat shock protein HslJ
MKTRLLCLTLLSVISVGTHAAEPETRAVEYYHPSLKHYFITASASEARFVDTGGAGEGWVRTGRSFGAWMSPDAAPAGSSLVYRFYSPGANSHFFSSDEGEVRWLRELEAKERASIAGTNKSFAGWAFEGAVFFAMTPKNGTCAPGTEAIKRVYNRGGADGKEGSNHRYMSDDNLRQSMEDRNWVNEGTVMCAPVSADAGASGGGADNSAAIAAGSYSGTVQFKYEKVGTPQVKFNVPLTLNLAANGALSGTGGGCTFAGSTTKSGSAARLLNGSVTATGCTDTRFNGVYGRVQIEQFGAKAIDIRFKQGDNAIEANIEGVLNLGTVTTLPNPNPNPTPVPGNANVIAGDFSGLAAWVITERPAGQAERVVLDVNQNLTLKITSAGVLSGSGQGCTFGGNLVPGLNNRFTGAVAVSGCTNARLNGNYRGEVHPEDGGAIEAEFENEIEVGGARTKVSIKGNLARASAVTPNPNPNPNPTPSTGIAIAGKFAGSASILATRRPNGGRETTEVNKTETITITVSSTGGVTGTGAGCSFTGNLAVTNAALGLFGGAITATGCSDAIVSGAYTAAVGREDGGAIELELEREVETNSERVKVKIKGRLAKQ